MSSITYEWKVDFAIIVSLSSIFLTVLLSVLQSRAKRRRERIRAYEAVYEDASFILEYPFRKRDSVARERLYSNENPGLQEAVRKYLDSHWMARMWGTSKLIPPDITGDQERFRFLACVMDEARKFNDELFSYRAGLDIPERSPVYHVTDPDVYRRLARVMRYVGHNLFLFSHKIRRSWERGKFEDPQVIRDKYEQCLRVCPDFFKHNPRDFEDPFYDMLEAIRQEYRTLTRRKMESIRWLLRRFRWKIGDLFKYVGSRKRTAPGKVKRAV